jgi:two-component system chemotaxis response regulator CheB
MGDDGARGMKEMHEAGAYTLAQDEKTSVVWGMPGQAVKLGGVDEVLPLGEMPRRILSLVER